MFNNEVTYSDRWKTKENITYVEKCGKLLKNKTTCGCSVPASWAKEVYELLEYLDKEFGIAYNMPYEAPQDPIKLLAYLFLAPLSGLFKKGRWEREHKHFFALVSYRIRACIRDIKFRWQRFYFTVKKNIVNSITKPKIRIDQVKEKYGELRIYYGSVDYLDEYIDEKIREVEIKLALKGAYFPVENLYDSGTSFQNDDEVYSVTDKAYTRQDGTLYEYEEVSIKTYRKTMRKMGLNIDEIKQKSKEALELKEKEEQEA